MLDTLTLLYVEGDVDILEEIDFFLRKQVKTLYTAKDATEGYELFKRYTPDLIITDIETGEFNGLDMLEKIREERSDIPVIVITALYESEVLVRFIDLDIDTYLLKPIDHLQLLKKIKKSIRPLFLDEKLEEVNSELYDLKIRLKDEVVNRTTELAQERNLIRTIIDTIPFSVYWKDRDSLYQGGNKAFLEEKGLKDFDDVIGKSDIDLNIQTYADRYRQNDQKIITSRLPILNLEEQEKSIEGISHYLLTSKIPLIDSADEVAGIVGITQDITEIKRKEADLVTYKERMDYAFTGSNDGLWDWDLLSDDAYFSPRWKAIIGYEDNELQDVIATWRRSVHPHDLVMAEHELESVFSKQKDLYQVEFRQRHKKGHWVWILARGVVRFDKAGTPVRMIGTHTDITEQKEAELRLQESQKYLSTAQQIAHLGSWKWDVLTNDLQWSDEVYRIFGEEVQSLAPTYERYLSYLPESEQVRVNEAITACLGDKLRPYDIVHQIVQKDGTLRYVHEIGELTYDEEGMPIEIIGTILDVTTQIEVEQTLKEQKEILAHQVHHDALTGLPNRVLFNDRLGQAIYKAKRNKAQIAVFFIDLDHFKQINDSLGHDVGDEVLKNFTHRLQASVREEDTLARMGGDEFMLIMEKLQDPQSAVLLAEKIIEAMKAPMLIDEHHLFLTGSIGISLYPQDGESVQTLIKNADAAMYRAKDEGRNSYQFYTAEMTELAFERVLMESNLRRAVDNEELIVYYQPQIDAKSERIIGMEALIRWEHPELGLVAPNRFLPLAEETGLIVELDHWVMETAMAQMQKWYELGYHPGKIALNLSIKQLQEKEMLSILLEMIEKSGCSMENIELEVTEREMMKKPETSIARLHEISKMGISLALDDFGTGYSSLSYLKRLPIDKLKIDQSFVRDLPGDEEDAAITRAVIALAQSLNLEIVAEGVETEGQRDFMLENGCPNIQGYLYARPMPAEEIEKLLRSK